MVHALKIRREYFNAVKCGDKTFEVRKNDRPYRIGDLLALNEWDENNERYTGPFLSAQITYILDDPAFCKKGYVILGIKFISEGGDWYD